MGIMLQLVLEVPAAERHIWALSSPATIDS
jgi:hypothetical protein